MKNEKHLALTVINRLAHRYGPASKVAKEMPGWLEYVTEVECPERPRDRACATWWGDIRDLAGRLSRDAGKDDEVGGVASNVAMLGQHFGLSDIEVNILSFLIFYQVFETFEHVVDEAVDTREVSLRLLLAQHCNVSESAIRSALRADGRLRASGILKWERRGHRNRVPYEISERLCGAMMSDVAELDELINLLFPIAPAPDAEWQDFDGIRDDAELMHDLISRVLAEGTAGVNILLYGPPGTGKTEFCKVLAHELGAHLRAIGETDDDGDEPSRRERLEELGLAGRMLGVRRDAILLFDEMEDLFGASSLFGMSAPSKVHSNRLLEGNPIPTLWTTNSIADCDPAFLRRMTYSVAMRPPAGQVRARIWQRLEDRHDTGIDADALSRMACENDLPPAMVADAMKVAQICEGGVPMFGKVLNSAARLVNGGVAPAPKHQGETPWLPALASTNANLERIEAQLSRPSASARVSFCLEGPAGTGKSAWARHLAAAIGLPVHEKRASDLMSKWVGESEQNIARAFANARAEGAMLIFDEADSLLSDRRGATHSWEVRQINEMLTWMESHPLPFVCTTNLADRLDPASQRRFTFRIHFDWLSPAQLRLAWHAHFAGDSPLGLATLDRLTPGDFANVARRVHVLGEEAPEEILAELAREVEAKEGAAPRPIGFVH